MINLNVIYEIKFTLRHKNKSNRGKYLVNLNYIPLMMSDVQRLHQLELLTHPQINT